jgi:enoyl-CoA hydratase
LIPKCVEIAQKILRNSPVAISAAIDAINSGYQDGVNGYEVEIECFGDSFGTDDFKEGTDAFLNKRKANF